MNYNIVVDTSNFKPYDITPALSILRDYRDAYYRIEDQMNKIAEERGKLMLSEQDSPTAKAKLDEYDRSFGDFVKDFSHGMNLRNAAMARQLRGQYSQDVLPIKSAVERYNKIVDQVNKLGPDAIFTKDTPTFDQVYRQGALNQPLQYRSRTTEINAAKNYFTGIFNSIKDTPEFTALTNAAEGYLYRNPSATYEQAYQLALSQANPDSKIAQALKAYLDNLNMNDYSDSGKQQMSSAVLTGLISAIPKTQDILHDQTLQRQIARNNDERQAIASSDAHNVSTNTQTLQDYQIEDAKQKSETGKQTNAIRNDLFARGWDAVIDDDGNIIKATPKEGPDSEQARLDYRGMGYSPYSRNSSSSNQEENEPASYQSLTTKKNSTLSTQNVKTRIQISDKENVTIQLPIIQYNKKNYVAIKLKEDGDVIGYIPINKVPSGDKAINLTMGEIINMMDPNLKAPNVDFNNLGNDVKGDEKI